MPILSYLHRAYANVMVSSSLLLDTREIHHYHFGYNSSSYSSNGMAIRLSPPTFREVVEKNQIALRFPAGNGVDSSFYLAQRNFLVTQAQRVTCGSQFKATKLLMLTTCRWPNPLYAFFISTPNAPINESAYLCFTKKVTSYVRSAAGFTALVGPRQAGGSAAELYGCIQGGGPHLLRSPLTNVFQLSYAAPLHPHPLALLICIFLVPMLSCISMHQHPSTLYQTLIYSILQQDSPQDNVLALEVCKLSACTPLFIFFECREVSLSELLLLPVSFDTCYCSVPHGVSAPCSLSAVGCSIIRTALELQKPP